MTIREREGLVARVRNLRRLAQAREPTPAAQPASNPVGSASSGAPARVDGLEQRVAHLERLLEGLQDSVHRESSRQSKRLTELETQIQPSALGVALDRDARERGL
jgi:hypothetical protein